MAAGSAPVGVEAGKPTTDSGGKRMELALAVKDLLISHSMKNLRGILTAFWRIRVCRGSSRIRRRGDGGWGRGRSCYPRRQSSHTSVLHLHLDPIGDESQRRSLSRLGRGRQALPRYLGAGPGFIYPCAAVRSGNYLIASSVSSRQLCAALASLGKVQVRQSFASVYLHSIVAQLANRKRV